MGQHKHNPTAIAAKNGEIKPHKKIASKKKTFDDIIKAEMSRFALYRFVSKYTYR